MTSTPKTGLFQRIAKHTTILAFVAGVVSTIGVGAFAASEVVGNLHGKMMSKEDRTKHVEWVMAHLYKAVDATDIQKAQLDPILRQGADDLLATHKQFHDAHQQLLTLMTQNNIDRAALEVFRTQQLQAADQASRRVVQLMADVGDVLTPAQRQALAAHIRKMRGSDAHSQG